MLSLKQQHEKLIQNRARRQFLHFVDYTWDYNTPFLIGYHTKIICEKIDKVIQNFREGKSSFVIISIAFRHGKSELVARKLPARFLAEFPEQEVMYVTHIADKAYEYSRDCRQFVETNQNFKKLYPDIKTAGDARNVKAWRLSNGRGKCQYFGFRSGIAGSGGGLVIIDDFFKNREDAESEPVQRKVIKEFTSGIMTRIPEPSIVFLIGTRWNQCDLIQYCIDEAATNPDFPQLTDDNLITMPGVSDQYPSGYLFPEKFSPQWYKTQKATLGTEYEYASLMQCQPILGEGNLFNITGINKIDIKAVPEIRQVITIDLASTEENLKNKDPDYTVCLRGGMIYVKGMAVIYITDLLRLRETATKRNKKIKEFIMKYEGAVYMECIAGYKDTFELMRDELRGIKTIQPLNLSGNKTIKAEGLVPIFDAGNINIIKAPWNSDFISECAVFDLGKHDDIVDCLAMIYHIFKKKPRIQGIKIVY